MSPKLQLLERKFARQNPERIPAPASDDLAAAIERLVQERVQEAQQKPSQHIQRLLDQQFKPKTTYTDFKQIPETPKPKTPTAFESVVSQRDAFGRIAKMTSKPLQGDGPTFETVVTQRDENGRIARAVTSAVDDPGALRT